MMHDEFFWQFQQGISDNRLAPYLSQRPSPQEALGLYAWNVALCESLYPSLNSIEVAVRNGIHDAAASDFGDEYWFLTRLSGKELVIASRVNRDLKKYAATPSAGDIVSHLWFGFWVKLLSNSYEGVLWPHLLRPVFPHAPRRQRKVKNLRSQLEIIRRLRNRVFHHEPIWHLPELEEQHRQILETIGWISPAMLAMTRLLDRFDSVYTRGSQPYATELESLARNWSA